MSVAPIALFCYNRVAHLRRTIEALLANDLASQSRLYIFSDGQKTPEDSGRVGEVRAYIEGIKGFCSVQIEHRTRNLGLANSIIDGVTMICGKHGRVIVLEDDIVTSPYFLRYMNDALDLYEDSPEVISIHGYVYPVAEQLPPIFFLRGADCWGWATWQRGWSQFNPDGSALLEHLLGTNQTAEFDFANSYPFTEMLRQQVAGRNDSWAIRWYASAFVENKLTLYPGRSLVHNIGNDASGTHCANTSQYDAHVSIRPLPVQRLQLVESTVARAAISRFFRQSRAATRLTLLQRVGSLLRRSRRLI